MSEEKNLNNEAVEASRLNELLDRAFPKQGVCAFCDHQDARHRIIDAIQDRFKAGETVAELATDYDLPEDSIRIAVTTPPEKKTSA